jgi:cyanophycin synthetase
LKPLNASVAVLKVIGKETAVPGYIHGFRSPVVLFQLKIGVSGIQPGQLSRMNATLAGAVRGSEAPPEPPFQEPAPMHAIVDFALHWTYELQRAGGLPVFERGRFLHRAGDGNCWAAVPSIEGAYRAASQAFRWVLGVINSVVRDDGVQDQVPALAPLLKNLGQLASRASNAPRFLRAASELDIPTSLVAGTVFQFGQGARARWLDSSFTDETPQLAAALARNKQSCARALRRAGIPVPAHFVVNDAEEALRRARELGYPVVVKPADKDGGVGVAAGLDSDEGVTSAFAAARQYSRNILVERHVEGRDYRIVVFRGDMIWAIERIPGGVTGDGVKSVRSLVDELNADPRRGDAPDAPRKPLLIDEEARRLLADAGLSLDSVPESGRFVFLRRAANVARGGTAEAVFDQVHPDNRRLAIRAAAALRLDLAGIDLLIPDIGRSWFETGAAICEVNGQPFLGSRWSFLYGDILRQLVAGSGRIPIAVLLGAPPDGRLAHAIAEKLSASGVVAGWADRNGATVGAARVARGPLSAFAGGQVLVADKTVEAAILCVNDAGVLRSGLPFDRYDFLVLAGNSLHHRPGQPSGGPSTTMQDLIQALRPSCQGKVFLGADAADAVASEQLMARLVDPGDLATLLCQEMLALPHAQFRPA